MDFEEGDSPLALSSFAIVALREAREVDRRPFSVRFADMHEIVDGLWLGSALAAEDAALLALNNVTAILSCALEYPVLSEALGTSTIHAFQHLPMEDRADFPDADVCIRAGAATIDGWLACDECILCHCAAGVSRSVACVVAYLMLYRRMTYETALAFVQQRRCIAKPNEGFASILRSLDKR